MRAMHICDLGLQTRALLILSSERTSNLESSSRSVYSSSPVFEQLALQDYYLPYSGTSRIPFIVLSSD